MNSFETAYKGLQARQELVIWDGTLVITINDYTQHLEARKNFASLKKQATGTESRTRAIQVTSGPVKTTKGSQQEKIRRRAYKMVMGKLRRFEEEKGGKDDKTM